ncbi:BPSL0761 family protein [Variovorax ginsengisoli]|uniref:BPSL0761 family protein n=1 Tax=Variovorax ginsengisoli TaxID=363844 RepID=A0ABT8S667_9BURK|nr:BPSL0761 family protein [Variovorax ginsengisoli]MDN8615249.1 BPSL0761 family protein [Variovorax ginsengisoli]MDO1534419.1 BPSL0761 family protein [Variovorax ginsengisoli]
MTMPYERRRALDFAGELMRELAFKPDRHQELWGGSVPLKLRQVAKHILRHYPEPWQIEAAIKNDERIGWWISDEPER